MCIVENVQQIILSLFPHYAQCSLSQALNSRSTNQEALLAQALVYYGLQNLQKSEEYFKKLLKISPDHKDGLYYLGHVYYKGQKYQEAVKSWKKLDSKYRDVTEQLKLAKKYSK